MKQYEYTLVFQSEPEGGHTVIVPALPGCVTYGRTIDEAKLMATDAIRGYIASLKKHREPIPQVAESFVSTLSLKLSA